MGRRGPFVAGKQHQSGVGWPSPKGLETTTCVVEGRDKVTDGPKPVKTTNVGNPLLVILPKMGELSTGVGTVNVFPKQEPYQTK